MEQGKLGHFLIYHILPVALLFGGFFGLLGLLMYFHKSKKRNQKQGREKPEKIQFPFEANPAKRRRRRK